MRSSATSTSAPAAPTYGDALARTLALAPAPADEPVPFERALGRTLRRPIVADRDQPPFDRATMDGYALRHADLVAEAPLPVIGTIAAGSLRSEEVPEGACVAIATGAALPPGVDTVIQHERSDRDDPVRFEPGLSGRLARGHAIHPRGADARAGMTLVAEGTRLNAMHLALAAAVGTTTLTVAAAPRVALITSGDEVVDPGVVSVGATQIRNSNGTLLHALIQRFGGEIVLRRHIADDADETLGALRDAIAKAEIVVTVGGVSAGTRDHFPGAITALGGSFAFRGARVRPGGPIAVGRFPARHSGPGERAPDTAGAVLVALPGNPVSALVCAHLLLRPLIARALGAAADLPWRTLPLMDAVRVDSGRQAFRPARWSDGGVALPAWQGSGDLAHVATTDGLVELPLESPRSDGVVDAGTMVRFLPWSAEHDAPRPLRPDGER